MAGWLVITGNVTANDHFGADGPAGGVGGVVNVTAYANSTAGYQNAGGVDTVIQGTSGDLVLHADGSYTFTLHAGVTSLPSFQDATDGSVNYGNVFQYTIQDGDGDQYSAYLTFGNTTTSTDVSAAAAPATPVTQSLALLGAASGGADTGTLSLTDTAGAAGSASNTTPSSAPAASTSSASSTLSAGDVLGDSQEVPLPGTASTAAPAPAAPVDTSATQAAALQAAIDTSAAPTTVDLLNKPHDAGV